MEALGSNDPRQVGQFRLVGVLGSGGMGRVFLGRGPDGAAVAVKIVHPNLLNDGQADFRRRFVREVDAARGVGSPFTAAVVDADPDAEVPWLATEYVPGIPLSEAVTRFGPLPEASLLKLAGDLMSALADIHAAGLVHRDVKPSNIMMGVDGPRLIDFGIARLTGSTGLTRTGQTVGTLGFMSPEQFERADVGPESDVFSAGAVLAYAATGRPPFPGDSLPVLFASLMTYAPDLDGAPPALRLLLDACLATDPAARPTAAAARTLPPPPPTHIGADTGWLPPAVTNAVLRSTADALRTPAAPDISSDTTAPPPAALAATGANSPRPALREAEVARPPVRARPAKATFSLGDAVIGLVLVALGGGFLIHITPTSSSTDMDAAWWFKALMVGPLWIGIGMTKLFETMGFPSKTAGWPASAVAAAAFLVFVLYVT
ncbi:serine/threonine-protein kinase [Streptomyces sp. NPDC088097]|uniref:serine/threonine-protein kinase n=1 Tax=Streptomyces sp. NPDC088097 TaxID=3365823 RepID=UPI0038307FF2